MSSRQLNSSQSLFLGIAVNFAVAFGAGRHSPGCHRTASRTGTAATRYLRQITEFDRSLGKVLVAHPTIGVLGLVLHHLKLRL